MTLALPARQQQSLPRLVLDHGQFDDELFDDIDADYVRTLLANQPETPQVGDWVRFRDGSVEQLADLGELAGGSFSKPQFADPEGCYQIDPNQRVFHYGGQIRWSGLPDLHVLRRPAADTLAFTASMYHHQSPGPIVRLGELAWLDGVTNFVVETRVWEAIIARPVPRARRRFRR